MSTATHTVAASKPHRLKSTFVTLYQIEKEYENQSPYLPTSTQLSLAFVSIFQKGKII